MYSYGSPHMAAQKQDDQHERTFSSYVRIQVVVLKTCLGRWTIGRSGERGSGISVLPARYDDDDDIYRSRNDFKLDFAFCFFFFFIYIPLLNESLTFQSSSGSRGSQAVYNFWWNVKLLLLKSLFNPSFVSVIALFEVIVHKHFGCFAVTCYFPLPFCLYEYVCILFVFLYIYVLNSLCVYIYVYVCTYMYVFIYDHVCLSSYTHIFFCGFNVCEKIFVIIDKGSFLKMVDVCIYLWAWKCARLCVCSCVCVLLLAYMCMHVYVFVSLCTCMHVVFIYFLYFLWHDVLS